MRLFAQPSASDGSPRFDHIREPQAVVKIQLRKNARAPGLQSRYIARNTNGRAACARLKGSLSNLPSAITVSRVEKNPLCASRRAACYFNRKFDEDLKDSDLLLYTTQPSLRSLS